MPTKNKKKKKGSKKQYDMFVTTKSDEELDKFLTEGSGGNFLALKDQDEVNVAFLAMPLDFTKLKQHNINDDGGKFKGSAPCIGEDDCAVCEAFGYDSVSVTYAPIYVFEQDKMMLFRCNATFMKEIRKKAKRSKKRWLKSIWVIGREGSGFDTSYFLDNTDKKVGTLDYEELDIYDLFLNQYNRFVENNLDLDSDDDDDDDDDMWNRRKKKSDKKKKSSKKKNSRR